MKFQSTNKKIPLLEDYYNHFDEDKRLEKRHGYVEFYTNMYFLNKYVVKKSKILDIGAGTGKYSLALFDKGHEVFAFELMEKHLNIIKEKNSLIPLYKGNALDLSVFDDNTFDVVILFGPMYHLLKEEERIQALKEAKRVVKKCGYIFVSYCMNEYAVISYGIKKNKLKECLENGMLDKNYHTIPLENDLYAYLRLEDIDKYNKICELKRVEIIASDGPANYLRTELNKMDRDTYNLFLDYHLKTCAKKELLGASSHVLDILKK